MNYNELDDKAKENWLGQFRDEVSARWEEIDGADLIVWKDLAYGWFLGKGLSPDAALGLAMEAKEKKVFGLWRYDPGNASTW